MSEFITLFADVIVPLAVKNEFTYRVPFELNDAIQVGARVVVPVGKSKFYTGIVSKLHQEAPTQYQVKYLEHLLDDTPIVTSQQFAFWKWLSQYYMASIGEVMNAALPSNFKLASETKVGLNPDYNGDFDLNEKEEIVIATLKEIEYANIDELAKILEVKNILPIIKRLIANRIISTHEELSYRYSPKTATFYQFTEEYHAEENISGLLSDLDKSSSKSKQVEAILLMLQQQDLSNIGQSFVAKKELIHQGVSPSALNTLEKNGIIHAQKLEIDRVKTIDKEQIEKKKLNLDQNEALKEINSIFKEKDFCLLHGVTGSGKTEIYVKLIEEQLCHGKQVLFLLPEIALTTQLIDRLAAYFGDLVGVYHSKFNQNERVEIWNHVLFNNPERYRIIVGARSSIFLPFQDLDLIIVDEEHESSFKQYDPAPRYNGRDAALKLAQIHNAKVLLGSATPAVETFYIANKGFYGLVTLDKRHGNIQLPEIFISDVKKASKQKRMQENFSDMLIEAMEESFKNKEQVILFQNRRGFTPIWTCEVCAWSPNCPNCDVTLTYHKHGNVLKCHYCSFASAPIGSCKSCGSNRLKMLGFGTEKIEDDLKNIFPNVKIARLDLDAARAKNAYQEIINDFANMEIDVLIGTQMISKGLDFDHVGLVGVLDADMLINRPDFRAFERSFQLMTQVAGRAGRKFKRGKVIIQTRNPEHWVLQKVIEHNYIDFYKNEILERENFFYPPFYKLIRFTLKNKNEDEVNLASKNFSKILSDVFKERVLGPDTPVISKINNNFLRQVLLKIERDVAQQKVKAKIEELIEVFYSQIENKKTKLVIDVDPA